MSNNQPTLRVGIWCEFGGLTLTPTEGIGVFVYNLAQALVALDAPVEVVLLVRQGDQEIPGALLRESQGRLRVVPEAHTGVPPRRSTAPISQTLRLPRPLRSVAEILRKCVAAVPANMLPHRRRQRGAEEPASGHCPLSRQQVIAQADCDVWLIPYYGVDEPLPQPSILMIHDLVPFRFPGTFTAEQMTIVKRVVPARVGEAAVCACMAEFIRQNDLIGMLQLPQAKTRMIRPAPPTDFPEISAAQAAALRPKSLIRPYLFYPAAFRIYKNHEALVETLRVLRDRGESWADVVFTGITAPGDSLTELIRSYGLEDRVHILGKVDRQTLGALYQGAFATIVPSLYEQGSFPVYEAIHWNCPVANSDIPSLREQSRLMGDAMLYFDPHNPQEIADVVLAIRGQRETIAGRQRAASRELWKRTWKDVAEEWLPVFREVAGRHSGGCSKAA